MQTNSPATGRTWEIRTGQLFPVTIDDQGDRLTISRDRISPVPILLLICIFLLLSFATQTATPHEARIFLSILSLLIIPFFLASLLPSRMLMEVSSKNDSISYCYKVFGKYIIRTSNLKLSAAKGLFLIESPAHQRQPSFRSIIKFNDGKLLTILPSSEDRTSHQSIVDLIHKRTGLIVCNTVEPMSYPD
jgi:hypothetical protein